MEIEIVGSRRAVRKQCRCEKEEYENRVEEDLNRQKQIRLEKLRKHSMIDSHFDRCRFEDFIQNEHNMKLYNLGVRYCKQWPQMREQNIGFLFHGNPGTGKTYLSFCIANKLLDSMVPVIAISSIGMLARIRQTYNTYGQEAEADIIAALKNASLLILDDLGAENDSPWAKEKLYEIIDSRYRDRKPMICTTNLSPTKLREKLTGDDSVSRTYDRLIEMCTPIEVKGPSRRAEMAQEKIETIKDLLRG